MNAMTIAHMAGILTSAIQSADRLELDAIVVVRHLAPPML